jgi:hypothetical protein
MTEQGQEKIKIELEEKRLSHRKSAELIHQVVQFLYGQGLSDVEISTVLYRAHRAFWPSFFINEEDGAIYQP